MAHKFSFTNVKDNTLAVRSRSLEILLTDIRTAKVYSEEETRALVLKAQRGDTDAVQCICRSNMRFVVAMAKRYTYASNLELDDLISEGAIGLMNAINNFDFSRKDCKFISYAMYEIRAAITNAIDNDGKLVACSHKLGNTFSESISAPKGDAGECYLDVFDSGLTADNFSDREHTIAKANAMLAMLTDTEREVITKYFGIGTHQHHTWEVALDLNLSERRCEQIRESALQKMRKGA